MKTGPEAGFGIGRLDGLASSGRSVDTDRTRKSSRYWKGDFFLLSASYISGSGSGERDASGREEEWERGEEKRRRARMALREKERARREQMEGLQVRRLHPHFESAILAALRKREGRATEGEIYEALPTLELRG